MSDGTFTIGVLAKRAGVGVQTVRYYERVGLLPQPGRAKSGYRRYSEESATRLQFIRHAARLGFTLAETKELLALRARRGAPCGAVRTRAEEKLAAIERKLSELRELRDAVAHLVHTCSGGTAVEHCSILAALSRQPETDKNQQQTDKKEKGSCPTPPRPARRPASRVSRRANAASKTA